MTSLKRLGVKAYLRSRPPTYRVPFAGREVSLLTDTPYTKSWYYRNRLRRAIHGYYEPAVTLLLERLAACKHTFLDVGSHLGYFSILFASVPGNEAVAIELDPSNFRALSRGVEAQPGEVRARIRALNVGISDEPGSIDLPRSRALDSSHRIGGKLDDPTESVRVPLTTIDRLAVDLRLFPDVIKIDVEGFEVHALRGARSVLANERPLLLMEVHPARIAGEGESVSDLIAILHDASYKCYRFLEHRASAGSYLTADILAHEDPNWEAICVHERDQVGLETLAPLLID